MRPRRLLVLATLLPACAARCPEPLPAAGPRDEQPRDPPSLAVRGSASMRLLDANRAIPLFHVTIVLENPHDARCRVTRYSVLAPSDVVLFDEEIDLELGPKQRIALSAQRKGLRAEVLEVKVQSECR